MRMAESFTSPCAGTGVGTAKSGLGGMVGRLSGGGAVVMPGADGLRTRVGMGDSGSSFGVGSGGCG